MPRTDALTKLYVEITTVCNLNCQMCLQRAWGEPIGSMPLSTFTNLMHQVEQFPHPPILHFGGYGEPMSHPDFIRFVQLAKASGSRVEVTTNATLLDADVADALLELDIDRLVVSIDGVRAETYEDIRVRASFEHVIHNMVQFHRMKIRRQGRRGHTRIGIAFVAMRRNAADLAELPRLATRIGANEILVSNLVPHTAEMEHETLYRQSLTACTYRASPWVPNLSLPKLDLDTRTLPALRGLFNSTVSISLLDASLSGRNDYCRFAQEGYAAIRWDGAISPCLPLLHDHPVYLRGRRKDVTGLAFGNINATALIDIWGSSDFTGFRARLRDFAFSPCTTCGGCDRFAQNFEDCLDNAFPTCGGCLWAQGFVQCP
jgi:MoaA/NifB/PqqE/SkfB family radical SAM enzyme